MHRLEGVKYASLASGRYRPRWRDHPLAGSRERKETLLCVFGDHALEIADQPRWYTDDLLNAMLQITDCFVGDIHVTCDCVQRRHLSPTTLIGRKEIATLYAITDYMNIAREATHRKFPAASFLNFLHDFFFLSCMVL